MLYLMRRCSDYRIKLCDSAETLYVKEYRHSQGIAFVLYHFVNVVQKSVMHYIGSNAAAGAARLEQAVVGRGK